MLQLAVLQMSNLDVPALPLLRLKPSRRSSAYTPQSSSHFAKCVVASKVAPTLLSKIGFLPLRGNRLRPHATETRRHKL